MFANNSKKPKSSSAQANTILHDWDRESDWSALEQLSEAEDVHTLGELFALHRVVRSDKERKGVREDKTDAHLPRQSAH